MTGYVDQMYFLRQLQQQSALFSRFLELVVILSDVLILVFPSEAAGHTVRESKRLEASIPIIAALC